MTKAMDNKYHVFVDFSHCLLTPKAFNVNDCTIVQSQRCILHEQQLSRKIASHQMKYIPGISLDGYQLTMGGHICL